MTNNIRFLYVRSIRPSVTGPLLTLCGVMSIIRDWEKCRNKHNSLHCDWLGLEVNSYACKVYFVKSRNAIQWGVGLSPGAYSQQTLTLKPPLNVLAASYVSPKSNTIAKALSYLAGSALYTLPYIWGCFFIWWRHQSSPVRQKINASPCSQEYIWNEHHLTRRIITGHIKNIDE